MKTIILCMLLLLPLVANAQLRERANDQADGGRYYALGYYNVRILFRGAGRYTSDAMRRRSESVTLTSRALASNGSLVGCWICPAHNTNGMGGRATRIPYCNRAQAGRPEVCR